MKTAIIETLKKADGLLRQALPYLEGITLVARTKRS